MFYIVLYDFEQITYMQTTKTIAIKKINLRGFNWGNYTRLTLCWDQSPKFAQFANLHKILANTRWRVYSAFAMLIPEVPYVLGEYPKWWFKAAL